MSYQLRFLQYNECSILVEWPAIIDENMLQDILRFKNIIKNNCVKENIEVITAYNSILIVYSFTIDNVNSVFLSLRALYESQNNEQLIDSRIFKIPVCYDAEFAVDIENFSKEIKLSKSEIIKRHSEAFYTVFFTGFLPGFLYLGGLNSTLHLNRKITPSLNVKKGSVGIGGKQTGIYPQDSPGGWHIIGNSPIELFNSKQNPPCFIKAGDKVKFYPITKSEYLKIQNKVLLSTFNSKKLIVND
ncbi:5-oxoprolinase subunit PxpB [Winogradskyella eximia]|uniref:5-oxoprolinase subunit PxpB n=1 Tax=Winogradskyella eximia TaxID=262006 RepID=UPI00248FFD21|nr:5-oxoprolinase subunit PxpB [Winogradskyella eximia]